MKLFTVKLAMAKMYLGASCNIYIYSNQGRMLHVENNSSFLFHVAMPTRRMHVKLHMSAVAPREWDSVQRHVEAAVALLP